MGMLPTKILETTSMAAKNDDQVLQTSKPTIKIILPFFHAQFISQLLSSYSSLSSVCKFIKSLEQTEPRA